MFRIKFDFINFVQIYIGSQYFEKVYYLLCVIKQYYLLKNKK